MIARLTIRRALDLHGAVRFAICDADGHPLLYVHSYTRAMAHVAETPAPLARPSRYHTRARWGAGGAR